ncbi:hypothetical protein ACEP1W_31190, partial [Pseudomonas aeruginosa]
LTLQQCHENAADRGQGVILSPVCGHLFVFHRSPADCSENGGLMDSRCFSLSVVFRRRLH